MDSQDIRLCLPAFLFQLNENVHSHSLGLLFTCGVRESGSCTPSSCSYKLGLFFLQGEQTNETPENDKDTVKSKKSTENMKSNDKDVKKGEDMDVDDEEESDDDDDDDSESGDSEIDDRSISQGRTKPENKTQGKEGSFEVVSQKHQGFFFSYFAQIETF